MTWMKLKVPCKENEFSQILSDNHLQIQGQTSFIHNANWYKLLRSDNKNEIYLLKILSYYASLFVNISIFDNISQGLFG